MTDVAQPHDSRLRAGRWVAAAMAASQLVSPVVINRVYGDFLSTGVTNDAVITPAGYAFSIWGLITLLATATCAAVLRFGLGARWETRLLAEASAVFAGFTGWLLLAAQNWLWATVAMFAVMVAALIDVVRLLVRHADELTAPTWLRRLATTSFGLYLGWSSIAVFANVAAALIDAGWPPDATGWQTAILVFATVAAVALTLFLRATPGYVAAVVWALVAVAIGAAHRGDQVLAAVPVAAALIVVVTAAAILRRRQRVRTTPAIS